MGQHGSVLREDDIGSEFESLSKPVIHSQINVAGNCQEKTIT
jgi:hypothetical protein